MSAAHHGASHQMHRRFKTVVHPISRAVQLLAQNLLLIKLRIVAALQTFVIIRRLGQQKAILKWLYPHAPIAAYAANIPYRDLYSTALPLRSTAQHFFRILPFPKNL